MTANELHYFKSIFAIHGEIGGRRTRFLHAAIEAAGCQATYPWLMLALWLLPHSLFCVLLALIGHVMSLFCAAQHIPRGKSGRALALSFHKTSPSLPQPSSDGKWLCGS
jgi:hypothetical protein